MGKGENEIEGQESAHMTKATQRGYTRFMYFRRDGCEVVMLYECDIPVNRGWTSVMCDKSTMRTVASDAGAGRLDACPCP